MQGKICKYTVKTGKEGKQHTCENRIKEGEKSEGFLVKSERAKSEKRLRKKGVFYKIKRQV